MKKALSLLLCLLLVAGMLAACGGDGGSSQSTGGQTSGSTGGQTSTGGEEGFEDVTLTMLVYGTSTADWNDGHDSVIQQAIKKATGVTLIQEEVTEEQLTVYLASGDLPDLVRVNHVDYGKGLIEGEHIVPLDDLLQSHGQDMLQTIPETLEYSRLNWSQGTEKTYFVPVNVGPDMMGRENSWNAIRWDYYQEIGAPDINTPQDLLAALKQMQDLHPTTEDGKKVYGFSQWSDWGIWYINMLGYFFTGLSQQTGFAAANNDNYDNLVSIIDGEKHPYWTSVRTFYEANQLGLLDPDCFTMTYADLEAKATSGQLLYCVANWPFGYFNEQHNADAEGFMALPMGMGYQWHGDNAPLGWADKCFAITKNCSNPEAAMRLMNFLWSYDGARIMYSGAEGENWNLEGGVPTLTDETIAGYALNDDAWRKTNIGLDWNIIGLAPTVEHPDGYPLSLFNTAQVYSQDMNPLYQDYSSYYNVAYPGEVFVKRLEDGTDTNRSAYNAFIGGWPYSPSDEIKRYGADVEALAMQYLAKCALAANDAEYEALAAEARTAFENAGAQAVYDDVAAWTAEAIEQAKKYE